MPGTVLDVKHAMGSKICFKSSVFKKIKSSVFMEIKFGCCADELLFTLKI